MAKENNSTADKLKSLSGKYKMYLGNDFLDTGSVMINKLFGGGFPTGKNIEVFSEPSYGKTTVVLSICKGLCRQGYKVLYIDAEGSIDQLVDDMGFYDEDLVWDEDHPDRPFTIIQTSYFEDIEEILQTVIPKYDDKGRPMDSDFKLVVIDSVAMLAPKEYKGDVGEKDGISIASNKPGIIARLMTAFLRKFNGYKTAYNMSFIYINQLREDLSMSFVKNQNKTTGGKALEYMYDVRVRLVARKGKSEDKDYIEVLPGEKQLVAVGKEIGMTTVKNKIGLKGFILPLYVRFGRGVSNAASYKYILPSRTIDTDKGKVPCLVQSGGWYTLNLPGITERFQGEGALLEGITKYEKECSAIVDQEDLVISMNPDEYQKVND